MVISVLYYFNENLRCDDTGGNAIKIAPVVLELSASDKLVQVPVSVTNASGSIIRIKSVKGGCSCISITPNSFELQKNEEIQIDMSLNVANKSGFTRESIIFQMMDGLIQQSVIAVWKEPKNGVELIWRPGLIVTSEGAFDGKLSILGKEISLKSAQQCIIDSNPEVKMQSLSTHDVVPFGAIKSLDIAVQLPQSSKMHLLHFHDETHKIFQSPL